MISPVIQSQMAAAVASLQADAAGAVSAEPGILSGLWADVNGASSAVASTDSLARAATNEAATFAGRYNVMIADPNATDADGLAFIRAATGTGSATAQVQAVANNLTPAAAVSQTVQGSISDIKGALPTLGLVGAGVVALALAVLYLRAFSK